MAVDVNLNRLPEVVGHVVEHAPDGIDLGRAGAVKPQGHRSKAI